jgi:DNA-binding transcriptional LysR family regulator
MLPSLESLECFDSAARFLNFRKGARAMGLTPAAFGQRIQKLEEQLGVKLFVRTTRTVHLTDAGITLRDPVERCLRMAKETMNAARGERTPPRTEITLGTRPELGMSWVFPQIDRLEKALPWLQLHLYFGSGPDLSVRVRTLDVDCAVTSTRQPFKRFEDAEHHALLDAYPDLPLFRYWREATEHGDRLRFGRIVRLGTVEAIRRRLLAEAGVAVLPEFLVRKDLKAGTVRRIFPSIKPLHDYLRLVFRTDDPRRWLFEDLARSLVEMPLQ